MKMRVWFVVPVLALAAACGDKSSKSSGSAAPPPKFIESQQAGWLNSTDTSVCSGGTAKGLDGAWMVRLSAKDFSSHLYIEMLVSGSSLRARMYCITGKQWRVSELTTPIVRSKGSFRILNAKKADVEIGELPVSCPIEASAGITNYRFNGRCLETTSGAAKATTWVPSTIGKKP